MTRTTFAFFGSWICHMFFLKFKKIRYKLNIFTWKCNALFQLFIQNTHKKYKHKHVQILIFPREQANFGDCGKEKLPRRGRNLGRNQALWGGPILLRAAGPPVAPGYGVSSLSIHPWTRSTSILPPPSSILLWMCW